MDIIITNLIIMIVHIMLSTTHKPLLNVFVKFLIIMFDAKIMLSLKMDLDAISSY